MGHVKPDGAAAGAKPTPVEATPAAASGDGRVARVWDLWRLLVKEFRTHRLLIALMTTWDASGFYGMDRISNLASSKMAKGARELLSSVDDDTLDALAALANTNAQRNEAMWRLAALFYVSVPMALFLASLDIASDLVREQIAASGGILFFVLAATTVQMLYYFAVNWRARQVVAVLEILTVERGRTPLALQSRRA